LNIYEQTVIYQCLHSVLGHRVSVAFDASDARSVRCLLLSLSWSCGESSPGLSSR